MAGKKQVSLTNFLRKDKRKLCEEEIENVPPPKVSRKLSPVKEQKQRKRHESEDKYELDFKWLIVTEEGYFCALCQKYQSTARNRSDVWINKPCVRRRRQSCKDHQLSDMHKNNLIAEQLAVVAEEQGQGAIEGAFNTQIEANQAAIISQLKVMYWLMTEEIPHTTKFSSLLNLVKDLGCTELCLLDQTTYTSERSIKEHVTCISRVIQKQLLQDIRKSPTYSILLDETTDISVTKQLIVYCKYLCLTEKKPKTVFLGMLALKDGKAATIHRQLLHFLDVMQIDRKKMVALGSDGANVMVGAKQGVAALLKQTHPSLINIHCIAHRLALAAGQASSSVPYLKKFKAILQQMFCFYENSAVRTEGLREIQNVLNEPKLKIQQAKDVRWLSHCNAVNAIRRSYKPLVFSLSREASERMCATAAGLHTFVTKYNFVASIQMMSDILPHLNMLSKIFQKESIDFTMVEPGVNAVLNILDGFFEMKGEHLKALERGELDQLMEECNVNVTPKLKDSFHKQIYIPYLTAITRNIKSRFPDMQILSAFSIFDPDLAPQEKSSLLSSYGSTKLEVLLTHFAKSVNEEETKNEWQQTKHIIAKDMKELTQTEVLTKFATKYGDVFPNISNLAAISTVMPVSTAGCERGFSAMNRIKTKSRNRLSNTVLNALMMTSIHGPVMDKFDFVGAAKSWGELKKRHLFIENDKKRDKKCKQLKAYVTKSILLRRLCRERQNKRKQLK